MVDVELAFFALFPLAFIAAILFARRSAGRWHAMGEALGYRPVGQAPQWRIADARPYQGTHGSWTVQVRQFQTGGPKNRESWTAVEVALPDADPAFTLRVTREGLGARVAKAFGGEDVEVGDPDFDRAFRVRASDPAAARRALDAFSRVALAGLKPHGELTVEAGARLDDGQYWPVGDPRHAARAMSLMARHRRALPEEVRDLAEVAARPGVALLRWVRRGVVTDPEAVRASIDLLARLAPSVGAAAPRPPEGAPPLPPPAGR